MSESEHLLVKSSLLETFFLLEKREIERERGIEKYAEDDLSNIFFSFLPAAIEGKLESRKSTLYFSVL